MSAIRLPSTLMDDVIIHEQKWPVAVPSNPRRFKVVFLNRIIFLVSGKKHAVCHTDGTGIICVDLLCQYKTQTEDCGLNRYKTERGLNITD